MLLAIKSGGIHAEKTPPESHAYSGDSRVIKVQVAIVDDAGDGARLDRHRAAVGVDVVPIVANAAVSIKTIDAILLSKYADYR